MSVNAPDSSKPLPPSPSAPSPPPSDRSPQYSLPDLETLSHIADLPVLDEHGTERPFSTLYTTLKQDNPNSSTTTPQHHLLIFIRHFFCGHCEDYVRALSTSLPPPLLLETYQTTLTIIGHGSPTLIRDYRTRTNCPFSIVTDPSAALHAALGMSRNLELGDTKPEYVQSGVVAGTLSSMAKMVGSGRGMWKGGEFSLNGGEWVFREGGGCMWGRRMENTRDHAEMGEIKEVLEGLRDD
ncbi:hypothetical protein B0A50_08667 [Salinomyces thailandicus]|uniref:AhpC/TSA antioxidant enzyme-domain-containing protein n=1 Tax=Salinomyces thailandicus TaxID=706561 RepID=A0A4U0TIW3_9PEZI|nr:hypothetical protein B0A50_08667 [Salinomyces thailandica]